MTETPATTGSCWNCEQPLQQDASSCLWCGVAQQAAPKPSAPPAGGSAARSATTATPRTESAVPTSVTPAATTTATMTRPVEAASPLGLRFAGSSAGLGARLSAFTVDALVVLGVAVVVSLTTGSMLLTAIAVGELLVLLWVLEARTGITPGNAVFGLRTSRDEAPFSPGVRRAALRHLVVGAGLLVGVVGAWAMIATLRLDSSGRRRSWADRFARTLVVQPPRRLTSPTTPARSGSKTGATAPPVATVSTPATPPAPPPTPTPEAEYQPPRVKSIASGLASSELKTPLRKDSPSLDDSASMSRTGVKPSSPAPVTPATAPSAPRGTPKETETSVTPAIPSEASAAPAGELLLVFDTGQRERLPVPVTANFGRKPEATDEGDRLIAVKDSEGTVSKTHLRLEHSRGRTWVTDLGSTNGTDLLEDDGTVVTLTPNARTAVDDGVRVRIGNRSFTISTLIDSKTGGKQPS